MQFVSFDLLVLHNTPLIDKKTTQKNKFLYSLFFKKKYIYSPQIDHLWQIDRPQTEKNLQAIFFFTRIMFVSTIHSLEF